MRKYREVIKRPIITEKSLGLAQKQNCYTFEVARKASKGAVKTTVEDMFGVLVLAVRTSTIPSKKRHTRSARGGSRSARGGSMSARGGSQRSPWKKAVVKLKEGDVVKGFEIE